MLRLILPSAMRRSTQFANRRSFASGHDEYVNFWQAPLDPAQWKKEQVVFAVLGGWTIVIMGARSYFSGGKAPANTAPSKASS